MAENKDIVELEINVEVTAAQKNVNSLSKEVERLTKALRTGGITDEKIKKNTAELAHAKAKLELQERKLSDAVEKQTHAEQNSTAAINKQIQALKLEQAQLSKNSAAYQNNASKISLLSGKLNANSAASGAATSSVMEMGRVISDAPYGMRGMANNLSQLTSLMFYASTAAGGLGLALKQMWKAMMGPLGIVIAITSVISVLDWMSSSSKKAKESIQEFSDAMVDTSAKIEVMSAKLDAYLSVLLNADKDSIQYKETLKALNKMGLDPTTMSIDQMTKAMALLKDEQSELIMLNDQLAFDKQGIDDYSLLLEDTMQKEADLRIEIQKRKDIIADPIYASGAAKRQAQTKLDSLEEELEANLAKNKEYDAKLIESKKEYQATLERILKIGTKDKKESGTTTTEPKDKIAKDHTLKLYDWTTYNNNLLDKHMKLFIHKEKAKLAYQQGVEVRDLQLLRDSHKKKEAIRLANYQKKQSLIINDATQTEATRQSARDASAAAKKASDEEEVRAEKEHLVVMDNLKKMHTDQTKEFDYHNDMEDKRRQLDKQAFKQRMAEVNESFMGKTRKKDYDARLAQIDAEIENNKTELKLAEQQQRDLTAIEKRGEKLREKRVQTQMELDAEVYAAKKAMMTDLMDSAISVFSTMKNAQEKGSKEEKKYALMEIYAGAAKGLMNGVLIAGEAAQGTAQAAPFIYASVLATQFASIYGAVSQAKSVLNGGNPSGGGTKVETPTFAPNFEVVGNSSQNQLAQSISDQTNGPTRAYVVYEDIAEAGATSEQSIESSGI